MNWTWSNTANYNFRLADKHDITVLLGTEMNKQTVVDFSAYSEEYALEDPDYMWPNAATGSMRNSGAKFGYRLASFFGKVDYNYDDFILASFTIRRDGSSRFGKDHRWGTFPAATLGFRLSKLMQKIGWTTGKYAFPGDKPVTKPSTTTPSSDSMWPTMAWIA